MRTRRNRLTALIMSVTMAVSSILPSAAVYAEDFDLLESDVLLTDESEDDYAFGTDEEVFPEAENALQNDGAELPASEQVLYSEDDLQDNAVWEDLITDEDEDQASGIEDAEHEEADEVTIDTAEQYADSDAAAQLDLIAYEGSEVGFYQADGVSAFGMLSSQDGSVSVLDGDEVRIYIVPSNKTVYGWIHWGLITDEDLTKDTALQENGYVVLTIGKEYCGYGIPVAPVKKKDGKTTGAQYYLCIPAEEKLVKSADYTAVDAALAKVPEDLSGYTEESAKAVTDAKDAVFRFKTASEQADVDAMAKAIEDAVAALEEKEKEEDADYSAVDAALAKVPEDLSGYTEESAKAVTEAAAAVVRGKKASEQADVDAMAKAIEDAVAALEEKKAAVSPFAYEGDEVTFISATNSAFSMFTPQEGTKAEIDGDNVVISYVPKNKTVYGWIHWGAIDDAELTKDVTFASDGTFTITLSKENCGWAIPVAPVKKSDDTASTSAQYYLAIPAEDKLTVKEAKVTTSFTAKEKNTDLVIENAAFVVTDADGSEIEAVDGKYTLIPDASYKVAVSAPGYRSSAETYTAKADETEYTFSIYKLNYYYWLQVCLAAKQYAESTPQVSGAGETVTIQKEGGEAVELPPTGSHYVMNNLEPGATYTIKVVWPGHDVITNQTWDTDKHGYFFETEDTTEWTYTTTIVPVEEGGEEFCGNLRAIFIEHVEEVNVDFTAVDEALAAVPENLRLFTSETADALRTAVSAVDRDASSQEEVDAMAEAVTAALQGLVPKDGTYEVTYRNYNGAPAYIYDGAQQKDLKAIKGLLRVENGNMTADLVIRCSGTYLAYDYAFAGTKEAALAAASADQSIALTYADKDYEGDGKNDGLVKLPVSALYKDLQYAYHSGSAKNAGILTQAWYDQGLIFYPNSLVPVEVEQQDERINLSIYDEELMFKVVNAYIEIKDGKAEFVFCLSAKGYEDVFAGTYDEAIANGYNPANWIHYETATVDCVYETKSGVQNDGTAEKYQFRIPVEIGSESVVRVPIVAISNTRKNQAVAANPENPDFSAAFTARQALIDLNAGTVRTGNYKDEFAVTVKSSLETFAVEESGYLETIGTPLANEYTCQPTITLKDETYDKAFIGSAQDAANAADSSLISIEADGKVVLKLQNSLGKDPQITDGKATVSFRVTATEEWIERILTVDTASKVITIDGDEVEESDHEIIRLSIYDEELMFKVVNAYIEKSADKTELVFCLSAKGYEEVFAGTYDEAIANGNNKENWITYTKATVDCVYETKSGVQNDGTAEKYQFHIPITLNETGETRVPIVAISHSRAVSAENANPEKPDYSAAFTARQALINIDEKTVRTGNYQDTVTAAVKSSIESMAVEAEGEIYTIGTPQANEYTIQATFTLVDGTYDAYFKGDAVSAAKEGAAITGIGEDGKVILKYLNSLGKTPEIDIATNQVTAAFRVAETGEWIDREITIDPIENTITINGEELSRKLKDGTYKAVKVQTDLTTEQSGMIMVTAAAVVVKDGQATAVVTMKGTGADRLYVSDTASKDTIIAEAIAEEKKEVGGGEGNLLGGLKMEGSSAYTFWPIPITLGEPKVYAARSASHFSKQDLAPEKYYYVHDFQIDEADMEYVSDSTDLPITEQQEAQRYLNQYFLDGKVVTSATAASVTGKAANVTIPYHDVNGEKISSVVMKMANGDKYRTGWFFDKSIQNTTYFTSSNLKKMRYPEGSKGTVTFSPRPAYRDEGMTFNATLRLYPAGTSYNQNAASEDAFYGASPLAEQTFKITLSPMPADHEVTIQVKDSVSGEEIPNAIVTVTKGDGTVLEGTDGLYIMSVPGSYTITASAEGYLVPGTEDTVLTEEYSPKKSETHTLKLIKAEESRSTVQFVLKDQLGEEVVDPALTVYRWDDKTENASEPDGSYKLYYGVRYGYTVKADGYEDKTGSVVPEGDAKEEVLINKYLSEQKFTFRVYDNQTNETLDDVTLVVKYGPAGIDEASFETAAADENGVYTIPIDNRVIAYGSRTGYQSSDLGVWSLGFDPIKNCSFGLKALPEADYTAVDEAIAKIPEDLSIYTDETAEALKNAVEEVDRSKKTDEQEAVDAMAKAIEDAIAALEEKAKYSVKYTFVSEDGSELPEEVTVLLPEEGIYRDGTEVNAEAPAQRVVETETGSWSFEGYDKTTVTISGDVTFTGTWSYADELHTVRYEFRSADTNELPEEVLALLPESREIRKGTEFTAAAPAQTEVQTADGSWSFRSYDQEKLTVGKMDITVTGTWRFTRNPEPDEPSVDEVIAAVKDEEENDLDKLTEMLSNADNQKIIYHYEDANDSEEAAIEELKSLTDGIDERLTNKTVLEKVNEEDESSKEVAIGATQEGTASVGDGEEVKVEMSGAAATVAGVIKEKDRQDTLDEFLPDEKNTFRACVNVDVQSVTATSLQMDISISVKNQENEVVEQEAELAAPVTITLTVPSQYREKSFDIMHYPSGDRSGKGVPVNYSWSGDTAVTFVLPSLSPVDITNVQCKNEADHIWDEENPVEQKAATCTEDGYVVYGCKNGCEAVHKVVIPKLGHQWGEWTEKTPADCEHNAVEERSCEICGEIMQREIEGTVRGHVLEHVPAKAATCTEAGNTEHYICMECGKVFSDAEGTKEITEVSTVIKAAGHKLVKTAAKAASCTAAGNIEYYTCSVCGKIYSDAKGTKEITKASTVVKAAGHKLVKTPAKAATTKAAGNKEYYTCSVCGKIYSDAKGTKEIKKADTVIPKLPNPEGDAKDKTSVAGAEKAITAMSDEAEPAGSSFVNFQVQSTKQTDNSITVSWNKVPGASGYIIYGNACGKGKPFKRLAKQTGNSYTYKNLKKGTYYKFSVVAYKTVNGKEKIIATGKTIHVATTGNKKITNPGKVKVKKKTVTLKKKGKKAKIKATVVKQSKKGKIKTHRKLKYESSNPAVATVNAKGKITAKGKGTCYIYVYAQNGVYATVKVTVKK